MAHQLVRIGIVGAGTNTRERHIPGFRAIPGVEVRGVVNRTPESTQTAARNLAIPQTYPNWQALVEDSQIDAVCIGTWPNLHCEITCAALAVGKHVLTEARMAVNAVEARQMLAAAQAHPQLVAQVVPSPFGLVEEPFMRTLFAEGYLGDVREAIVLGADDAFWDYSKTLHWRQDAALSGNNVLSLGILHETLLRWLPQPEQVFAQTAVFEASRPSITTSEQLPVTVPEVVQVLASWKEGTRGTYRMSGLNLFGPGKQIHLYGSRGTLKLLFGQQTVFQVGRAGDRDLRTIEVPVQDRGGWRVEAEFVGAIRGRERVRFTDFATGVKYMEFTDAVHASAKSNQPVRLP